MRIYCVGGAVRDELLGLPVHDRDWVVVGATPPALEALGFRPVGRDFPVFLHPETREEYALARTERKTGPGYHGFDVHFAPDVTLEEDLKRRDLTINAMARDTDGALIDPWHGQRDLRERVLRHVSEAFGEDPVRILRLARFAARFHRFSVAEETMALMRKMVEHGEVDALVPERVWQELARGLMESHPSRMFVVLRDCGALERILPELAAVWRETLACRLDAAAARKLSLPARFAVLVHAIGDRITRVAERLRAPSECRDVARLLAREAPMLERAAGLDAEALAGLVERLDGLRRRERMEEVLAAGAVLHPALPLERVRRAAEAMRAIDAGAIASAGPPATIGQRLHAARAQAVAEALNVENAAPLRSGGQATSPAATTGSSTSAESTNGGRTA
jgi:tRNA nucleotidyltransferase (CCA-adding enzyme)